jgi:hypothetical protein
MPGFVHVPGELLKPLRIGEGEAVFPCVFGEPFPLAVLANSSVMEPKSTVSPNWCCEVPGLADSRSACSLPSSFSFRS